ncbi:MAG: hypothetical protein ACE5JJ_11970 [Nitrospinota bacterium]
MGARLGHLARIEQPLDGHGISDVLLHERRHHRPSARARERLGRESDFLDRHLLQWFPAFTAAAEDAAQTPFYRRLLRFAREFALEDRNLIARVLRAR